MRSSAHSKLYFATASKLGVQLGKNAPPPPEENKASSEPSAGKSKPTSTTTNKKNNTKQTELTFAKKMSPAETNRMKEALTTECLNAHVEFRIKTLTPVSRIADPSFFKLRESIAKCAIAQANYEIGSRMIKNQTKFLADEGRKRLKEQMKGQTIALTTDHWTSRRGHTYASFTAQFIDVNFEMQSTVLAVYQYHGSTSADKIVVDFKKKLEEWEIPESNAKFLVTDTAANMNLAGIKLSAESDHHDHIYCLDHVIQVRNLC